MPTLLTTPFPTRLALAALLACVACGPRRLAVIGPVADPEGAAAELRDRTRLDEPLRIVFAWHLNEGGQRVNGRGVARVEPPYKARLDLFLHNLETVTSAGLVDDDLRLLPGAPDDILPPPDLMWGVLGIFRPPANTRLLDADELEGDAMRLRYGYDDGRELHYEVVTGSLRTLELLDRGRVVERVRLEGGAGDRYPVEATYRNMTNFRELTLERESLQAVEPFDPEIWDPRS
jgi:hypothetical protein